jgi:hypothetical protein
MPLETWSWGIFLICPIWSFIRGSYWGTLSVVVPLILGISVVITNMRIPLISDAALIVAFIICCCYSIICSPVIGIFSNIGISSDISWYLVSIINYLVFNLIFSLYICKIRDDRTELIIARTNIKWNRLSALLFIPLVATITLITGWSMNELGRWMYS